MSDEIVYKKDVLDLLSMMPPEEVTRALLIQSVKQLPSAQPEPHWIPCSVKLPTEGQLIYASFPYLQDYVVVKYYTELRDAIDAWIPLPESYERK